MSDWTSDPVGAVERLVGLAHIARYDGAAGLRAELPRLEEGLLRQGLALVLEGLPPDLVAESLEIRIARELVTLRLVKAGIIALQRGLAPHELRALLAAQLSSAERERLLAAAPPRDLASKQPEPVPDVRELYDELAEYEAATGEDITIIEDITKFDDESIKRLVQLVHRADLVNALPGATETVRVKILKNVSPQLLTAIQAVIGEVEATVQPAEIEEAQQRIVAAAVRLADQGQIRKLVSGGA